MHMVRSDVKPLRAWLDPGTDGDSNCCNNHSSSSSDYDDTVKVHTDVTTAVEFVVEILEVVNRTIVVRVS